jgi:hypothetical protein
MEIKMWVNQAEIHLRQGLSSGKCVGWRAVESKEKMPAVVESY